MPYDPCLGEIRIWAPTFAPRGWAFCAGQLLSIAQNSALFALIGTYYGGDGRTTFALPDLRGRVVIGAGQAPGLPNYALGQTGGSNTVLTDTVMAASGSDAEVVRALPGGYDNRQPFLALNYIIALQGIFPSRP